MLPCEQTERVIEAMVVLTTIAEEPARSERQVVIEMMRGCLGRIEHPGIGFAMDLLREVVVSPSVKFRRMCAQAAARRLGLIALGRDIADPRRIDPPARAQA
jgi:hypothetical protein